MALGGLYGGGQYLRMTFLGCHSDYIIDSILHWAYGRAYMHFPLRTCSQRSGSIVQHGTLCDVRKA